MSPGPSLAVVLQQTLRGGRRTGLIAATTHGLGIGLYAMLCISGIAVMITASPLLFTALQWLGAGYLIWLGIKGLRAKGHTTATLSDTPTSGSAARDGFLVVFLNPKVAVFFIALFSQVIGSDTTLLEKLAVKPFITNNQYTTIIDITNQAAGPLFQGNDSLRQE